MTTDKPKFVDSEYFVADMDNWYLKDGAPAGIVKEFNEYMKMTNKYLNSRVKYQRNKV